MTRSTLKSKAVIYPKSITPVSLVKITIVGLLFKIFYCNFVVARITISDVQAINIFRRECLFLFFLFWRLVSEDARSIVTKLK